MSDVTHQLKVYGSVFSPEPVEVYELPDGVILGEWLAVNVKGFDAENSELAFSLPFNESVSCDVSCHLSPKKSVVSFIAPIFALPFIAFKQVMKLLTPKSPSVSAQQQQSQGSEIDIAAASSQTVKYGQPIREAFGRTKIVPDYLVPPRRYFRNKKEHWVDALLCVGVGEYDAPLATALVTSSPIIGLGGDNSVSVFSPNSNLAGVPQATWWHSAKEVGFTASGQSGLPLKEASQVTRIAPSGSYTLFGKTVTPNTGQSFPSDWESGMYIDLDYYLGYSVSGNSLSGNFSGLQVEAGDSVTITGDTDGSFAVESYAPATAAEAGTPSIWTASSAPDLDYSTTKSQIIVNYGNISGVITIEELFASEALLVAALNDQLSMTALSGIVSFSAGLEIVEQPNYRGALITVTDISGASRMFGSVLAANAASVVGNAMVPAAPAKLTMTGFSYYSATVRLSIKKQGESFVLTGATTGLLTVDRVDNFGVSDWLGWNDSILSNDTSLQLDPNTIEGGWVGTFAATPANELCTALEVDILFPQGLIKYNNENKALLNSVGISFRYRSSAAAPWSYFNKTYSETEKDQIGFTETINLPYPMAIKECQMKRGNAESVSQSNIDKVQWYGLKARMARQTYSYPLLTTMAIKLNGEATSAQSDSEVSIVATRKLDGVATRSISDAVKYIARNADIDIASFAPLDAIWDARSDTFDFQFNKFTTVKSAANTALSAGFADFTVRDGLLTPIREAARPPELLYAFNHTYSAQNTTGDIVTQIKMPDTDEIDGYDVEYIDSATWRVETVRCQQAGSLGNRIEKITADGITNRTKAYQWGMRALMTKLLDSMSISTKTELDAKNSNYGDYVSFVQEVPEWSQSAIVESVNGVILTSTEPLNWVSGAQNVVALQMPNGRMSELQDATQISEYQLSVSAPWSFIPKPHATALFFGIKDRFATAAIVRNVKPSSNSATISASVYNADIYQYDDAEAPQ